MLGTAAACWLSGALLGYPELVALGVGLALLVTAALVTVWARPKASLRRGVEPDRVSAGGSVLARVEMTNRTRLPAAGMTVVDRFDGREIVSRVGPLPARGRRHFFYVVDTPRRGRFVLGPLTVRRSDAFGLTVRTRSFAEERPVWVYPRVHRMAALPVRAALDDDAATARMPRGSSAVSSPREYVVGDDPRHLHWPLTARTGTLMVREREESRQSSLTVVVDTRAKLWDGPRFEAAVEVTASLVATSGRDGGHEVQLGLTDADRRAAEEAGATSALDRLATLRPRSKATRVDDLLTAVTRSVAGALAVVTGDLGDESLAERLLPATRRNASTILIEIVAGATATTARRGGVVVVRGSDADGVVGAWNALVGSGGLE
jgi:uncharacterized protein (DUF58 family)